MGSPGGRSAETGGTNRPVLTSRDRGSQRGAKWFIVAADRNLYTYKLAREHGIQGIVFRSGKEARRWLTLLSLQDAGAIRNLRRGKDAKFALQAKRPDGLMETVCHYIADFCYDEPVEVSDYVDEWRPVVEDTKPGGFKMRHGKKVPFREEIYELKKKWFEAQYGVQILES